MLSLDVQIDNAGTKINGIRDTRSYSAEVSRPEGSDLNSSYCCSREAKIRHPGARRVRDIRKYGRVEMQDSQLRGRLCDGDFLGPRRQYKHLPKYGHRREIRGPGQRGSVRQQC